MKQKQSEQQRAQSNPKFQPLYFFSFGGQRRERSRWSFFFREKFLKVPENMYKIIIKSNLQSSFSSVSGGGTCRRHTYSLIFYFFGLSFIFLSLELSPWSWEERERDVRTFADEMLLPAACLTLIEREFVSLSFSENPLPRGYKCTLLRVPKRNRISWRSTLCPVITGRWINRLHYCLL